MHSHEDFEMMRNQTAGYKPSPLCEVLARRKESLERELAEVEQVMKALDENPEIEKVADLICKVRGVNDFGLRR